MAITRQQIPGVGVGKSGAGGAYGAVPNLPTSQQLQGNITGILNQAIPGYTGLTQSASSIIGDSLSGKLPGDVQNLIRDQAATQAVAGGMPGSSQTSGTLYGNRTLRDLGLTSLQRQDAGVKDLIGMLQGVSGTAAPNFGQVQDQENARAEFAAAPDPAAAAGEQERLFNKYSTPARGTGGSDNPWYYSGVDQRLVNSGASYSIDPLTGKPRPLRY